MDIIEFRDFCLGLGDVEEKVPFGKFARKFESTLVFYVCGHMFALCDMEEFDSVGLRLPSEKIDELFMDKEAVAPPHNPAMKLWVSVTLGSDISDPEVLSLTRLAYETVKALHTPRK